MFQVDLKVKSRYTLEDYQMDLSDCAVHATFPFIMIIQSVPLPKREVSPRNWVVSFRLGSFCLNKTFRTGMLLMQIILTRF